MTAVTDRVFVWWYQLPTWAKWAIGVLAVLSADAVRMAWGDTRPVGAFFEALVAVTLYWGIIFGTFAGAIWTGIRVAERTSSRSLGWIVGFVFFFVFGTGALFLTGKIPGVGWRIEALLNSDRDDIEYGRR